MATRIGVDIGGTFTDLVYYDDETGETVEGKVPTVPHAPEEGVVDAVKGHVPTEVIEKAEFFLHGTTVGLNALLERRGAKVGLITTEGFRDVLEIRRGDRAEMYNLFWKQPEPLVPRHLRLEVVERIKADGSVYKPLDEALGRARPGGPRRRGRRYDRRLPDQRLRQSGARTARRGAAARRRASPAASRSRTASPANIANMSAPRRR